MSEEIAVRLQHVRKMYGLSQRELAKRAGVTNSIVSMIEQGRVSPSFNSLEKLLNGIPMTMRDFFNFDVDHQSQSFYQCAELFEGNQDGVDTYNFNKQSPDNSHGLNYQIYQPGANSGSEMQIAKSTCYGIIIHGELEVTINNQCQTLSQSEAFIVKALSPWRVCNLSQEKAILITSHHLP